MKSTSLIFALSAAVLVLASCYEPPPITEGMVVGGDTVDAATLTRGRKAYRMYCASCHGIDGDGRGPSSARLNPRPRDFRIATFKFTGIVPGRLPHDEDLLRIISKGLHGTGMVEWQIPDHMLLDIIQYIKTFSPDGTGWRKKRPKKGERIVAGADPWTGKQAEAIERGKQLYHGMADCHLCHPAFATLPEVNAARKMFDRDAITELRTNAFRSEVKVTDTYTEPVPGDPACGKKQKCPGKKQICVFGRCEAPMKIVPPDFLVNEVRAGKTPAELYRVIAAGIPGTAMPTWKSLEPEKLWAMSYYVSSLIEMKGTPEALALQKRLAAE